MGRAGRGLAAATVAALVVTLLGACGRQAAGSDCASTPLVTSASVTRPATKLGPPAGTRQLHATSHNSTQAETLYGTACRLVAANEHFPPHTATSCPADFGLVYDLVFSDRSGRPATASYHASGCESLSMVLPTGTHRSTVILGTRARARERPFDAALASILGVSVAALHGLPG